MRARTLKGIGFNMSFGRLPGSLCNKYMLVDGDKVVFGSYRSVPRLSLLIIDVQQRMEHVDKHFMCSHPMML